MKTINREYAEITYRYDELTGDVSKAEEVFNSFQKLITKLRNPSRQLSAQDHYILASCLRTCVYLCLNSLYDEGTGFEQYKQYLIELKNINQKTREDARFDVSALMLNKQFSGVTQQQELKEIKKQLNESLEYAEPRQAYTS